MANLVGRKAEIIDTMIVFPAPRGASRYAFVQKALGQHATGADRSPVAHVFKDAVEIADGEDPIDYTLEKMDKHAIGLAVIDLVTDPMAAEALRRHPDRFVPTATVDPNEGMKAVRAIAEMQETVGLKGVSFAPSFCSPQVAIDDRRAYPVYAKCAELDLPIFITVGVPGPRIPLAAQKVELLDEVCWFFPELKIIMRHGGEPWDALAVTLMRKWPNLYYSTSAFSPKRYPKAIIDFTNKGGREKVMFAGYYAAGLSWERVFAELEDASLLAEVKPLFLADNARRVLGL